MHVEQLMTRAPRTCGSGAALDEAARIMWEADCGIVPVVDDAGRPLGVVTDRDIAMTAFLQHRRLDEITVDSVMCRDLVTCAPSDGVVRAEHLMRHAQIRRLLVVDDQGKLVGLLSINDLVRESTPHTADTPKAEEVLFTLALIGRPRTIETEHSESRVVALPPPQPSQPLGAPLL